MKKKKLFRIREMWRVESTWWNTSLDELLVKDWDDGTDQEKWWRTMKRWTKIYETTYRRDYVLLIWFCTVYMMIFCNTRWTLGAYCWTSTHPFALARIFFFSKDSTPTNHLQKFNFFLKSDDETEKRFFLCWVESKCWIITSCREQSGWLKWILLQIINLLKNNLFL